MGERELQEALRSKAQERMQAAWQTAEAAVAARRAELDCRLEARRAAMHQQGAAVAAAERRGVLSAAERSVREQRLAALSALAERLHVLALQLLTGLDGAQRRRLWHALAGELPAAEWRRVQVHPDDLEPARQAFAAALVEGDAELAGGLVVATADGRIEVDNSFAGRLERAWPSLLTPLVAAAGEEADKGVAGSGPAG